jgi:hypothetical protein
MIYLVGAKVTECRIMKSKNCDFIISMNSDRMLSKTKTMLVAYSPIIMIVLIGLLAIFSNIFLILFLYILTNLRKGRALPSDTDIMTIKKYDDLLVEFLNNMETTRL